MKAIKKLGFESKSNVFNFEGAKYSRPHACGCSCEYACGFQDLDGVGCKDSTWGWGYNHP